MTLTPEQTAVVRHEHGPALVFAVAGAGKTTAMVHRIERLVRDGVFPAERILATSFSRASVADLRRALGRWPACVRVETATLHSVGLRIVREAERRGLCARASETGGLDEKLLAQALAEARRCDAPYRYDLDGLDHEDFRTYVGACKGNLRYADLEAADLPDEARAAAGEAITDGVPDFYPDLYRLFEEVRRRQRVLTFDDMLMTAWELLVRDEALLAWAQGRYECLVVDEFQDVNHAQSELLDLLARPHRNLMVVGDDDQTIYEWRGASPTFILDFERRYGARRYLIRDNFRSRPAHLALAHGVIRRNRRRHPKRLSPTRPFGGALHVHRDDDPEATAQHVATRIEALRASGQPLSSLAVLVRVYAQTPPIEAALIERAIPYRVVGSTPFYERPELAVLLRYLSLAAMEAKLEAGGRLSPPEAALFRRCWLDVYNRPTRYLPRPLAEQVARRVTGMGEPLALALQHIIPHANRGAAGHLESLAETMTWLAALHDVRPAADVLVALDGRLGYKRYLRDASATTGAGKAAAVDALIRYAHGKGTPADLLDHLRGLARARRAEGDVHEAVALSSIHRAKGLEWPVVFVPDCNESMLPFGPPDDEAALEEERRLFYVAATRAQEELHLHATKTLPLSSFLKEGAYRRTLAAADEVQAALEKPPADWSTADVLTLARNARPLGLERFLERWWPVDAATKREAAATVVALCRAAEAAGLYAALGLKPDAEPFWHDLAAGTQRAAAFPDLADFAETPLAAGQQIEHPTFGAGEVVEVSGPEGDERVRVRFVGGEEKKLVARLAGMQARET